MCSIFLFGCKESSSQTESKLQVEKTNILNFANENQSEDCLEVINKIVRSSNLNLNEYDNVLIRVDRIENDNITIQVYTENNLSDNGTKKEIVETTIAWLQFTSHNEKLLNITSDPENPVELQYDKSIIAQDSFLKNCGIKNNQKKLSNRKEIKHSILPFDFEEYYSACVYPSDTTKCLANYPKYNYGENSEFDQIIDMRFRPSEYIYLPNLNSYQPVILCNNNEDIESYNLIVIKDKKITSFLRIGEVSDNVIKEFNISKDFIISIYIRKNAKMIRKKEKVYQINHEGKIVPFK